MLEGDEQLKKGPKPESRFEWIGQDRVVPDTVSAERAG